MNPFITNRMKFVSWNVNGLRAVVNKGAMSFFEDCAADFLCLQEIKASRDVVESLKWGDGLNVYVNEAAKKGYSGTATITPHKPLSVTFGLGWPEHDNEGRVITLEMPEFFLVNVYTPNSQNELRRLPYRQKWDQLFLERIKDLEKSKPVVFCGDLNVAHTEDDLANPKSNRKSAGFTDEERADFDSILSAGFVDVFREFYQGKGYYSWWSYRTNARARNVGWRIDYFIVSEALRPRLKKAEILTEVLGSDHCPVTMEWK